MNKKTQNLLLGIVFVLFVLSGSLFYKGYQTGKEVLEKNVLSEVSVSPSPFVELTAKEATPSSSSAVTAQSSVKVTRVVDGDTIQVSIAGKTETVRFIGVNTPETVDPRRPVQCFGKEASDETKKLLAGQEVVLEKDVSETDKYNRLLRYIYLKTDQGLLFVNDYLVREGFAQVSTYPPDVKYEQKFLEAQNQAKQQGKGLWGKCN